MKKIFSTACAAMSMIAVTACYADYRPYIDVGIGYAAPQSMPNSVDYTLLEGVVIEGYPGRTDENYGGRAVFGILWDVSNFVAYGLEGGAAYYGSTKYTTSTSTLTMHYYGLELLGVAQFTFDKLHFTLKAGGTDEQMQPAEDNMRDTNLHDSNTVVPEVGASIAYSFTPSLQLGLSYYHTFGQDVNFNNNGDAESLPSINMGLLEFTYFI